MISGGEVVGTIAAIKYLLGLTIYLANGLKGASRGSIALVQQIITFSSVLQHAEQEFKTILRLHQAPKSDTLGVILLAHCSITAWMIVGLPVRTTELFYKGSRVVESNLHAGGKRNRTLTASM